MKLTPYSVSSFTYHLIPLQMTKTKAIFSGANELGNMYYDPNLYGTGFPEHEERKSILSKLFLWQLDKSREVVDLSGLSPTVASNKKSESMETTCTKRESSDQRKNKCNLPRDIGGCGDFTKKTSKNETAFEKEEIKIEPSVEDHLQKSLQKGCSDWNEADNDTKVKRDKDKPEKVNLENPKFHSEDSWDNEERRHLLRELLDFFLEDIGIDPVFSNLTNASEFDTLPPEEDNSKQSYKDEMTTFSSAMTGFSSGAKEFIHRYSLTISTLIILALWTIKIFDSSGLFSIQWDWKEILEFALFLYTIIWTVFGLPGVIHYVSANLLEAYHLL